MKSFNIGCLAFYFKKANSGSWSITSARTNKEHLIRFGIISESSDKMTLHSLVIGPYSMGMAVIK